MKKVFLDTNIILDFVLNREGAESAVKLLALANEGKIQVFVSFLTIANTAYVAKRGHSQEELYTILSVLNNMVNVLPMDSIQFGMALKQPVSDFEDMLQYQCASINSCDVIITNNIKHFYFSSIPVKTAKEYLDEVIGATPSAL